MDWAIDQHTKKGGRTIRRIDLDSFEWDLFLEQVSRLYAAKLLTIEGYHTISKYYYRGIPVMEV